MGYDIRWATDEQTIILCEMAAEWTWEEMYVMVEQQLAMMATVDHLVHTIIYTQAEKMRIPPNALSHFRRLLAMTHPNEDGIVIVGGPVLVKNLFTMLNRVYGVRDVVERMMFTDTLAEAYALLATYEQRTRDALL